MNEKSSSEASTSQEQRERLMRRASVASVATAFTLIIAKLFAWLFTGSVSVLASLVDSMLDAMASLVNFLAVRYSLKPADDDHQFGHGKAESLAALLQTAFICGSAIFLIFHAIDDLRSQSEIVNEQVGVWVILFSIALTAVLILYQGYVVKRTGSITIKADALHYRMDLLTNASVLLALILSSLGYQSVDALVAIGIAVYMLYGVREIVLESFDLLMDRQLPVEQLQEIESIALSVQGVQGVHDLKTRRSGIMPIIQLHLEMDGSMSLKEAHDIADRAIKKIKQRFTGADVTIHQDPV
ncbi:cation diffusion facilitator family transporter [Aestuariirhabdus sp. Z084]|uniref:cation diffusion facilitator family transporter n=1 Tax=Aestuariirhabdus haliotis TaxID=2918751 RepID=UPI00201B4091|nr:cation diffusion facilitator family transporter [Aestuariirhabdus haliotis]MCL6414735.1 cation diffusion facilitator family transporter [Aestuariirhabdus haliotis]MCL6418667.1 cation diffusion facilitator family transporter [Aestuariirhabdus haliotis]